MGLDPASAGASVVCPFANTLNMNIAETSLVTAFKFHPKYHWGRRKAALGLVQDHIRALVSISWENSVIACSRLF